MQRQSCRCPGERQEGIKERWSFHWRNGWFHEHRRSVVFLLREISEADSDRRSVGFRSAIYQVLKSRGYDPVQLDPWYFPSVEDYRKVWRAITSILDMAFSSVVQLLVAASFKPIHLSLTPRFTPLPGSLRGWLQAFTRDTIFAGFEDEEAEEMMEEVEEICQVDCQDGTGKWAIMYMRLRFSAILL